MDSGVSWERTQLRLSFPKKWKDWNGVEAVSGLHSEASFKIPIVSSGCVQVDGQMEKALEIPQRGHPLTNWSAYIFALNLSWCSKWINPGEMRKTYRLWGSNGNLLLAISIQNGWYHFRARVLHLGNLMLLPGRESELSCVIRHPANNLETCLLLGKFLCIAKAEGSGVKCSVWMPRRPKGRNTE